MQIKEFKFLSWNENFIDEQFKNWSRCYEWGYVLHELNKMGANPLTIHNTCCGPSEIHKKFHYSLNLCTNRIVYNSDSNITSINKDFTNFHLYNILNKSLNKYDVVLCISTLEEISDKELNIKIAFQNLYDQVKDGGRLIITCDYPMIQPELLESLVGEKIKDTSNRLTGMTSYYKQPEFKNLSIILLDIQK